MIFIRRASPDMKMAPRRAGPFFMPLMLVADTARLDDHAPARRNGPFLDDAALREMLTVPPAIMPAAVPTIMVWPDSDADIADADGDLGARRRRKAERRGPQSKAQRVSS